MNEWHYVNKSEQYLQNVNESEQYCDMYILKM